MRFMKKLAGLADGSRSSAEEEPGLPVGCRTKQLRDENTKKKKQVPPNGDFELTGRRPGSGSCALYSVHEFSASSLTTASFASSKTSLAHGL